MPLGFLLLYCSTDTRTPKMAAHLPWALLLLVSAASAVDYDVVVYGSTPAGISGATAAAQLGARVALFEPLPMIGGMGAAGNLALHDGNTNSKVRVDSRWRTPLLCVVHV